MRWLIYFIVLPFCFYSCSPKFQSKGFFAQDIRFKGPGYFVTETDQSPNNLLKITDSSLYYYEWKTIEYNRVLKSGSGRPENNTSFKSFKTITNKDIKASSFEEKHYLKRSDTILKNYLIFIDDYRCIYVSQDDTRSFLLGEVPLYFDNGNYKPKKNNKRVFRQFLRGYYAVKDSAISIDFERTEHFFVRGRILKDKGITFDEISLPGGKTEGGVNRRFVDLSETIDITALPVFELPDPSNFLVKDEIQLTFGFAGKKIGNELHKKISEAHKNDFISEKITGINYDLKNNKRVYRYKLFNKLSKDKYLWSSEYSVEEDLAYDKIPTW